MRYFNETIINTDKEIAFLRAFVSKVKSILGNRIVLVEQQGKEYIQGEVTPPTSIASGYGFDLVLDNKITISFTRGGTGTITGYSIKVSILGSSSTGLYYTLNSTSLGWNTAGTRVWILKGVQTSNLLIFIISPSASSISSKNAFVLSVLKNSDTYGANRTIVPISGTEAPPVPSFSPNSAFSELSELDTLTGQIFTLVNRFQYNYNIDAGSKQTEIRKGKVAVLQNSQTKLTSFNDLYDTSVIPQKMFVKINNQNCICLNQFTIVNIQDEDNLLNT